MTTDQSTNLDSPRDKDGKLRKGAVINPKGKGGFQERPQDISPGGWKKEESISYQYNRFMRMSPNELEAAEPQTVAQQIALVRLKQAIKDAGLNDAKEITDRTEGKAPQYIGLGDPNDAKKALVEFIYGPDDQNTDTD